MGYLFLLLVTLFRCTVRKRYVVLLHRQRLLSCYLICSMTAGQPAAGFIVTFHYIITLLLHLRSLPRLLSALAPDRSFAFIALAPIVPVASPFPSPPGKRSEQTSFPRKVGHPEDSIQTAHGAGPYAPISPPSTSSHPTTVTVPPITSAPSSMGGLASSSSSNSMRGSPVCSASSTALFTISVMSRST